MEKDKKKGKGEKVKGKRSKNLCFVQPFIFYLSPLININIKIGAKIT